MWDNGSGSGFLSSRVRGKRIAADGPRNTRLCENSRRQPWQISAQLADVTSSSILRAAAFKPREKRCKAR
jgi:hypothetical protein